MIQPSILLVGCGNMAGAMLRRWLDQGLSPDRVTAISPSGRVLPAGVRVEREWPRDTEPFDVVMLGIKPQRLADVLDGASAALAPRLLISILAGVELATLRERFAAGSIVRAMPNLPVALGKGVVALHGEDPDGVAAALMAPLGLVEWIADERSFDLVTALAGSGPAFLYRFVDALAEAGAALGLAPDQAARLALATVAGAAALAAGADESPATLADRVASPGGSTREGLNVLDRDGALSRLLMQTLAAATRRNGELAAAGRS
ncbi:MAG: pyrroline-5-carboxylate reductase family protein [Janthinobacterium lividum]